MNSMIWLITGLVLLVPAMVVFFIIWGNGFIRMQRAEECARGFGQSSVCQDRIWEDSLFIF